MWGLLLTCDETAGSNGGRLLASHTRILELSKNILEADERIRPALNAWPVSGDMNYNIRGHRVRRAGVQVWLTIAGMTRDEVQAVAENLAIEETPPGSIVFNEAEARAVSNLLGCQFKCRLSHRPTSSTTNAGSGLGVAERKTSVRSISTLFRMSSGFGAERGGGR